MKENWFQKYDWFDFYRDAEKAIPPNMPEARGREVVITCFIDANLASNQVDRLIFVNKAPIQ